MRHAGGDAHLLNVSPKMHADICDSFLSLLNEEIRDRTCQQGIS
jgi:hypothetical protein